MTRSPPCPRCGAEYPDTELYPDGSVFCSREGLIVGRVDVPPRGWYLMFDDPSRQLYWDPDSGWSGMARPAERDTKPFPVERLARMVTTPTDGTKTCPPCAENVQGAALVCRFCGYSFDGWAQGAAPMETNTSGAAVAAFICSLLGLWVAGIPLG